VRISSARHGVLAVQLSTWCGCPELPFWKCRYRRVSASRAAVPDQPSHRRRRFGRPTNRLSMRRSMVVVSIGLKRSMIDSTRARRVGNAHRTSVPPRRTPSGRLPLLLRRYPTGVTTDQATSGSARERTLRCRSKPTRSNHRADARNGQQAEDRQADRDTAKRRPDARALQQPSARSSIHRHPDRSASIRLD